MPTNDMPPPLGYDGGFLYVVGKSLAKKRLRWRLNNSSTNWRSAQAFWQWLDCNGGAEK